MRVDRPLRGIAPGQVRGSRTVPRVPHAPALRRRSRSSSDGTLRWLQTLVLYAGPVCLGSATIDRPGPSLFDLERSHAAASAPLPS